MSKRAGQANRRRKERSLVKWTPTTGKTGSHRNGGGGFHKIPIAGRETDASPSRVAYQATPACVCGRSFRFESYKRGFWWVCYRCRTAIAYKPLKTGLKATAA